MKKSAYTFLIKHKDEEAILAYIYHCLILKKDLSVDDLAKHCYMSKSSITRFFQNHGYDGFKEFKHLLMNENVLVYYNQEILDSEFEYQVMINPIKETSKLNNQESFKQAYEYLKLQTMNYIIGVGGNDSVCLEFYIRLNRLGFLANRSSDFHNMYILLSNIKPNDLVWVFSYSGETKEVIKLTKLAKEKQAKIIAITRNEMSSLTSIADLIFKLDNTEDVIRIFALKSRTAMNYIVNKLVWYIYCQDKKFYNEKMLNNLY